MSSSVSYSSQLSSGRETWKSKSGRWGTNRCSSSIEGSESRGKGSLKQMEGVNMYGVDTGGSGMRKRVMVVVDQTSHSKHAMMFALTHVANKGDLLTLLHIINPNHKGSDSSGSSSPYLANCLGSLCKACKPEVEVEALVIQGPKMGTVMSQVKKLEVSVLVLGQIKSSPLSNCLCGTSSNQEFVNQCINNVDCLTIGVKKQSKGMGGYLISTRWQKNFWLLA
ncbi:Usp domain-containing protein [Cephalotus follicularis]|uniref:Usp domain-containing protein n=1 Tax=Cephalotus follicularis TaxID=3775 RepID=A0A1Q3CV70_CEPFO|nr:Usp domain-containing protein [Cephalotus follicularis]